MNSFMCGFSLLAQAAQNTTVEGTEEGFGANAFLMMVAFIIAAGLIFSLGNLLAKALKMADDGWKIGLVLLTIVVGIFVTTTGMRSDPPKLKQGIDLVGGSILVYEVSDQESNPEQDIKMPELVAALKKRINPSGVKEIVVRPYGDRQVEIIIPKVESAELDYIKRIITTAGALKFRILASRTIDDPRLFEIAERDLRQASENGRTPPRQIIDGEDLLGEWVWIGLDEETSTDGNPVYKVDISQQENMVRELRPGRMEVLTVSTPFNVEGKDLASASADYDEVGQPAVVFTMTGAGAAKFGGLTSTNLNRRLGIVLDEHLQSAPTINATITSRGIIEGRFSQQEVAVLSGVLKAGKLPTALKKDPISENDVSAILGKDTVDKGKFAIMTSLIAVLVFMVIYYRFAGIVACLALATNLLLILSLMILFKAALTLPGLAGLVLTVGMSVDANVLIFERIREELARGAALRMAIRNGFGRATRTIVDANITTLLVAVVLYAIGTDQIKGFAVTLFLGILMSMYSAVFCSRIVFDIAERKRWISKLSMTQLIGATSFDFIGKRQLAAIASLALILVGLFGAFYRGKNLFDIDFNGGTSVQVMLENPKPIAEVRALLKEHLGDYHPSIVEVDIETRPAGTVYKIDTAITGEINEETLKNRDSIVGADISGLSIVEAEIHETLGDTKAEVNFISRDENTGHLTAEISLAQAMNLDDVRSKLAAGMKSYAPIASVPAGSDASATTTIQARLKVSGTAVLQDQLLKIFAGELVQHQVDFSSPQIVSATTGIDSGPLGTSVENSNNDATESTSENLNLDTEVEGDNPLEGEETTSDSDDGPEEPSATSPNDNESSEVMRSLPSPTLLAFAGNDWQLLAQADTDEDGPTLGGLPTTGSTNQPLPADTTGQGTGLVESAFIATNTETTETTLQFGEEVTERAVRNWLQESAASVSMAAVEVLDAKASPDGKEWTVQISANVEQAEVILNELKSSIGDSPVWLSSNKIGAKVADDMRNVAIASIMGSLLGIVIYIWVRFQHVFFGLAAVVALVHDVLITLGALALSFWLADFLGILLITEFKINLPIVAAFLTIIGYSLNDTIVVFDRIREVRGKSPDITGDMINASINQTLARTFLTSITTLIVVMILYIAGGESIHGFAFALVVGVLVGTYSSIFVASPVLLWMSQPAAKPRKDKTPVSV